MSYLGRHLSDVNVKIGLGGFGRCAGRIDIAFDASSSSSGNFGEIPSIAAPFFRFGSFETVLHPSFVFGEFVRRSVGILMDDVIGVGVSPRSGEDDGIDGERSAQRVECLTRMDCGRGGFLIRRLGCPSVVGGRRLEEGVGGEARSVQDGFFDGETRVLDELLGVFEVFFGCGCFFVDSFEEGGDVVGG